MLSRLLRSSKMLASNSAFQACRLKIPYKTERYFNDLSLSDMVNEKYIRKLIRTKLPGVTMKSQRGLYHGKVVRTGHRITFSDKKTKRRKNPNVVKKTFVSKILQKKIKVNVTTTMLRVMRKYGSFDNYILLARPQNMRSLFGEYLRKMMLEKLNNPDLNLSHCRIFGTNPDVKSRLKKRPKHDYTWHPPNVRHKDQTMNMFRGFNEMTKEELGLVA